MKAAEKCFIREVHSNEKVYTLFAGVARRKLLARCRCFDLAFTLAKNTRHAEYSTRYQRNNIVTKMGKPVDTRRP